MSSGLRFTVGLEHRDKGPDRIDQPADPHDTERKEIQDAQSVVSADEMMDAETSEKVDSTGTVQDGVIKLDSFFGMDWPMTFVKDGVTPPDMNKEGDSSAASSADASAK